MPRTVVSSCTPPESVCLTLRENTERPATVEHGSNQVVGVDSDRILNAARSLLRRAVRQSQRPPLWDGKTAPRIVTIIRELVQRSGLSCMPLLRAGPQCSAKDARGRHKIATLRHDTGQVTPFGGKPLTPNSSWLSFSRQVIPAEFSHTQTARLNIKREAMADHEKFDGRTQVHGSRRAYKPSSQPGRLKNGAQKRALSPSQTRTKKGHRGTSELVPWHE
jgi:hypothetical protein